MFPQTTRIGPAAPQPKIEKQFMGIDKKTNWIWWKEQMSYLFISVKQITEVRLIPATDSSFNVYARLDLKDKFEYFLIDNRKTLAAAKKLAEDFAKMLQSSKEEKLETIETKSDLNGLEALRQLKTDLNLK